MNSFFASCEIAENPELKGKKIAVAPCSSDRKSIILSASYEARPYGIRAAMRVSDALDKCPDLILVEPSHGLYTEYSQMFFDYFLSITPLVEPASIDEGFLDITDVCKPEEVMDLVKKMQEHILNELHLPCSIGIAPNKFLAKMASDMKKPMGITILRKREVEEKLWPLPISDMIGVGKKTLEKFQAMNIKTIGELANYQDVNFLNEMLGVNNATYLRECAFGNGSNEIDVNRFNDVSSISNSQTFDFDEYKIENMLLVIKILTNSVANRLEKHDYKAYTFTLQIKYNNFKVITRAKSIETPIRDAKTMYNVFKDLFEEYYDDTYPVRLLGVAASKLIEQKETIAQINIFDPIDDISKAHQINSLINNINKMVGKDTLKIGVKKEKSSVKKDQFERPFKDEIKKII